MGAVPEKSSWTRGKNWHNSCKDEDLALTLDEAYRHGGLDWKVKVEPTFYRGRLNPSTGKALPVQVPDRMAVVRESDGNYLGSVGSRFTPIQNEVIKQNMELVLGHDCLAESAISLFGGAVVIMTARSAEKFRVLGDEFRQYFFLANRHDGKGSIFGGFTNQRIVCENTWRAAQAEASNLWKGIRHTKNGEVKLDQISRMIKASMDQRILLKEEAEEMYKIKLGEAQYQGMVNALLPYPEDPSRRQKNAVNERRALMWMALKATDLENIKRTGWAFLQGVVDYAEHAPPAKATQNWEDRRIITTLQGDPLVEQARQLVLAYN